MRELIITNDATQMVITRLACVNSAVFVLGLLHGRPAKSSVEEVLQLAEQLEAWAWRGLLPDVGQTFEVSPRNAKGVPFIERAERWQAAHRERRGHGDDQAVSHALELWKYAASHEGRGVSRGDSDRDQQRPAESEPYNCPGAEPRPGLWSDVCRALSDRR